MKNIFTNSQKIKVLYITTEWEEAPFIKQQVEHLGLSFAFPSRSIYIEKNDDKV